MRYILCPKCEVNYMSEEQEICDICRQKEDKPMQQYSQPVFVNKEAIRYPKMVYKQRFFYVFQGGDFEDESANGYIFAPKFSRNHHWNRVAYVDPGNIIFHAYSGYIKAISIATSKPYNYFRNGEQGNRVDCSYVLLQYPLDTKQYKTEILEYSNDYSPFNKHGTGNQGYLFDINNTLSSIFIEDISINNPNNKHLQNLIQILTAN